MDLLSVHPFCHQFCETYLVFGNIDVQISFIVLKARSSIFHRLFLLFYALKDNYAVNIVLVSLLNSLICYFSGPFQMGFFDKFLMISSFSRLPFPNSSNFLLINIIILLMLTGCNSLLIWLSFIFFVAMHNSSTFILQYLQHRF